MKHVFQAVLVRARASTVANAVQVVYDGVSRYTGLWIS
jgi:hypothetical protein